MPEGEIHRADKIGAAMGRQKITDAELARLAGVHRHTVRAARDGEPVKVSSLKKIADALGLSMQELFEPREEGAA